MLVLYFHCTDGVSFFADQQGLSVTREDEIFPAAQFQREFPNYRDMMRELRGTGLARTEGNDQPLTRGAERDLENWKGQLHRRQLRASDPDRDRLLASDAPPKLTGQSSQPC
jgi:hypothetical protein